jgi:hypothetical protein
LFSVARWHEGCGSARNDLAARGLAVLPAFPPALTFKSFRRVIVHDFVNTLVNLAAKVRKKIRRCKHSADFLMKNVLFVQDG